ncbi:unnamed protein product [Oikopleura dioica]|uniref:Uncharacterized protein n=1 Tax=Oikopleura dioica TaxID=34765 RepID=E4YY08_OIKDI|nr:unnamed protein product [Oikopleura dioica]
MLFEWNFLFFTAAAPGLLADYECENQEISDQCFAECRLDYLNCRAECDSSLCDSQCLENFQICESSCPCSVDCPSGCKDCPDHPLCHSQSTTEATTTELVPIEPNEVKILVIMPDLRESYLTSGDGETVTPAKISAPRWDFTAYSRFAVVEGKLHVFGGWSDNKKVLIQFFFNFIFKIARLEGCTLVELSASQILRQL